MNDYFNFQFKYYIDVFLMPLCSFSQCNRIYLKLFFQNFILHLLTDRDKFVCLPYVGLNKINLVILILVI